MDWFENLRRLKAQSNMSMREIAIKSGIPEPTLEKIFSGATKSPGVNTIQSLVHALGYTLNDIDPSSNKKSPNAAEAVSGDKVYEVFDYLNKALVSAGLIQDGEDITDQQAEILLGVCNILRAAFDERN